MASELRESIPTFNQPQGSKESSDVDITNWSALTSTSFARSWGEAIAIVAVAVLFVVGLEVLLRVANVPTYTMPRPSEIGSALFGNFDLFAPHLAVTLRVQSVRLILETAQEADEPSLRRVDDVVRVAEKGFVESYLTGGRPVVAKPVTLRRTSAKHAEPVFGRAAREVRSEALLALDLGPGRLPGLLALGASDPLQFKPTQGTELLTFLAAVFERLMRRWLA